LTGLELFPLRESCVWKVEYDKQEDFYGKYVEDAPEDEEVPLPPPSEVDW